MSGANFFVVYTSSGGKNVTVSPRLGSGHSAPTFNSAAQVTLLEGSGVKDGVMTANIKCKRSFAYFCGLSPFAHGCPFGSRIPD